MGKVCKLLCLVINVKPLIDNNLKINVFFFKKKKNCYANMYSRILAYPVHDLLLLIPAGIEVRSGTF